MSITTNNVSIKVHDAIDAKMTGPMSPVQHVVLVSCKGQTPTCITHDICVTKDYCKESFEAEYWDDRDDECYTLAHYERTIENGVLTEMFANKHIFSIADIEMYLQTPTDSLFTSDCKFFGINLIEMWGKWDEVIKLAENNYVQKKV